MASLTRLRIYPIKSLQGTDLTRATVDGGRLVGDRVWMLVDAAGAFMHQRDYPQMARVRPAAGDAALVLTAPGMEAFELPRWSDVVATARSVEYVQMWRRSAAVAPVGAEVDAWFSDALGVPCRLVAFLPNVAALNVPWYETTSALQDATPFHLTSEDSLADLNARMAEPIPMDRFRPNLVVAGAAAYAEDGWDRVTIGACTFQHVKPCTRCVMTTTDQTTGVRHRREPLATLATYRRLGNEVAFGHYLTVREPQGVLCVGDAVAGFAASKISWPNASTQPAPP
jgi:uncharacterized protein YcbX